MILNFFTVKFKLIAPDYFSEMLFIPVTRDSVNHLTRIFHTNFLVKYPG